jgi:hypothetical protein
VRDSGLLGLYSINVDTKFTGTFDPEDVLSLRSSFIMSLSFTIAFIFTRDFIGNIICVLIFDKILMAKIPTLLINMFPAE